MGLVQRHWKKVVLTALVTIAVTVFVGWWIFFRVDPEFQRANQANIELNQQLDEALGLDDDFDDLRAAKVQPAP